MAPHALEICSGIEGKLFFFPPYVILFFIVLFLEKELNIGPIFVIMLCVSMVELTKASRRQKQWNWIAMLTAHLRETELLHSSYQLYFYYLSRITYIKNILNWSGFSCFYCTTYSHCLNGLCSLYILITFKTAKHIKWDLKIWLTVKLTHPTKLLMCSTILFKILLYQISNFDFPLAHIQLLLIKNS